uniref:Protein kinase domain-containing protein n=1 Tax=Panagrolaimus sp. ES5 TaxID=591445 RepID=A0AC34FSG8_9BILA
MPKHKLPKLLTTADESAAKQQKHEVTGSEYNEMIEEFCKLNPNITVNEDTSDEEKAFLKFNGSFTKDFFQIDNDELNHGGQTSIFKAAHISSKFALCVKTYDLQGKPDAYFRQIYNEVQIMFTSEQRNILDIKPPNILLNSVACIKLADFGSVEKFSENLNIPNTTKYSAPNAAECKGALKVKKDIWSLGITLLEMLNGKFPFNIVSAEMIDVPIPECSKTFYDFISSCVVMKADERADILQLMGTQLYAERTESSLIEFQQWVGKINK